MIWHVTPSEALVQWLVAILLLGFAGTLYFQRQPWKTSGMALFILCTAMYIFLDPQGTVYSMLAGLLGHPVTDEALKQNVLLGVIALLIKIAPPFLGVGLGLLANKSRFLRTKAA